MLRWKLGRDCGGRGCTTGAIEPARLAGSPRGKVSVPREWLDRPIRWIFWRPLQGPRIVRLLDGGGSGATGPDATIGECEGAIIALKEERALMAFPVS
jgi:hypothetical protein